jgi:ERCC4-type nuclease
MTIICEGREPLEIQGLFDRVESFKFGDFIIEAGDKKLIIERKKIGDLWNSLKSGRLNEQLSGCDALLIHHDEKEYYWQHNIEQINLWNTINGISRHHIVWHVIGLKHLEDTLRRYERQMYECKFDEFRKIHVKRDIPVSVRILADFENIGEERARMLLRHYKSLNKVFQAADELEAIPGIGGVLMAGISQRLDKEEVIE